MKKFNLKLLFAAFAIVFLTGFLSDQTPQISSVSPTLSDDQNVSANRLSYWREGSFLVGVGSIQWDGAGGGSTFTVTLPNSLVIDHTRLPMEDSSPADNERPVLGELNWFDSGVNHKHGVVLFQTTTALRFHYGPALSGTSFAASDGLNYRFKVPIVGW